MPVSRLGLRGRTLLGCLFCLMVFAALPQPARAWSVSACLRTGEPVISCGRCTGSQVDRPAPAAVDLTAAHARPVRLIQGDPAATRLASGSLTPARHELVFCCGSAIGPSHPLGAALASYAGRAPPRSLPL